MVEWAGDGCKGRWSAPEPNKPMTYRGASHIPISKFLRSIQRISIAKSESANHKAPNSSFPNKSFQPSSRTKVLCLESRHLADVTSACVIVWIMDR